MGELQKVLCDPVVEKFKRYTRTPLFGWWTHNHQIYVGQSLLPTPPLPPTLISFQFTGVLLQVSIN